VIVESVIISSAVVAGREAMIKRRKRQADLAARTTWLEAIQTSQSINAQLSAARKAMVDEVRRHQGVVRYQEEVQ
jgi:hypothetical protein